MEVGLVQKIDIDEEMQQAYLDYAMSVIVSRALPDARDGLKPVHRRILYAMHTMGLQPDSSYKKSARIVGEVLGKYHPHSDAAVYDAMARMAQDFSMRYPLVDGQGNFGSVDGDPPAAMRYTEARLASPAVDILNDLEKDTVDFESNFDDSLPEPTALPAALPNMLVNGATGIAVGMSTNIPPHNLDEVVEALVYMLENWTKMDDISVETLMRFIKGPDFPTGGVILRDPENDGLSSAYGTGRGRITVQARARIEEMDRNRNRIIVSELPYMTNKTNLLERIAKLTRDGDLEGVTDLRDESDRHGMRIVIELTKNADPEEILQLLFKRTTMRGTFGIITLALVDGEPRMLSLKQALRVYLEHRLTVVRRRSQHELDVAERRAHILEGLRVALQNLDEIIALIRKSRTAQSAHNNLRREFKLSAEQAQAILDMPLRRLATLERKKVDEEYKEQQATIKALKTLLRSPKKQRQVVSEELRAVQERFGDGRRTQIVTLGEGESKASVLTASDVVPDRTVWVSASPGGVVARTSENRIPRLSGRAAPGWLMRTNTRDTVYLIDERGEAAAIAAHVLPEERDSREGLSFERISPLSGDEPLGAMFSLPPKEELDESWFLVTVSRQGMVKKSPVSELPGPSARPFTLVRINEDDRLGWVQLTDGKAEVLLVTAQGMAIRFSEEEVRPMGLVAAGVMGIKLKEGDEVVGVEVLPSRHPIYLQRSDGHAKRVRPKQFPTQGRYGQGVIAWKLPEKTRLVGTAIGKGTTRVSAHLLRLAPKSIRLDSAPIRTRPSRGKSVVEVKERDQVVDLTVPWDPPRPVKD